MTGDIDNEYLDKKQYQNTDELDDTEINEMEAILNDSEMSDDDVKPSDIKKYVEQYCKKNLLS